MLERIAHGANAMRLGDQHRPFIGGKIPLNIELAGKRRHPRWRVRRLLMGHIDIHPPSRSSQPSLRAAIRTLSTRHPDSAASMNSSGVKPSSDARLASNALAPDWAVTSPLAVVGQGGAHSGGAGGDGDHDGYS